MKKSFKVLKMKKPNLFIVGPQRSGTTSLHNYLGEHLEIFMSELKEPGFFSDFKSTQVVKTLKEYQKLFKDVKNERIIGESTPWYISSPNAPKKLYKFNPKAKIIIMVRDPNEGLLSLFKTLLLRGDIRDDVLYWEIYNHKINIDRFKKVFPSNQILLIDFKDFTKNTKKVYQRVLKFLKCKYDGKEDFPLRGKSYKPKSKILNNLHNFVIFRPKLKSFLKIFIPKSIAKKFVKLNLVVWKTPLNIKQK